MKNKVLILLGVALLLAACKSSSAPETNLGPDPSGEGDMALEDLNLAELPFLSALSADPTVVGPGEGVQINGVSSLSGTLTLTDPSGESGTYDFANGKAEIQIMEDAVDGIYQALVENQFGALAFGSFRVASEPGIWLSADQTFPGSQDVVQLRVTAHRIPQDMTAVFHLGLYDPMGEAFLEDFDPDEPVDFTAFEGPTGTLVPDSEGVLVPGALPGVPVSELFGRPLYLPGKYANTLQIQLFDPATAQMILESGGFLFGEDLFFETPFSNAVEMTTCNQPGEIHGNLGSPGFIRAVSLGGDFPVFLLEAESGDFFLPVSAGDILITGWHENGLMSSMVDPQIVKVACGERIDVELQVAGDMIGDSKDIVLTAQKLAAPAILSHNLQGGRNKELCRSMFVPDIQGSYENATAYLGTWTSQLFQQLSRVSILNANDIRALLDLAARQQLLGTEQEDSVDVYSIGGALNVDYLFHSSVNEFEGQYFANWSLIRMEDSTVIYRTMEESSNPEGLIDLPGELLTAAQKAGLCAEVEPTLKVLAPDELVELELQMTDLNGEAFDKVAITVNQPNCGDLEWTEQELQELTITNQYTGNEKIPCTDKLKFIGKTQGPGGKVIESRPDEATVILQKTDLWDYLMTLEVQLEEGGYINFEWNGDLFISEDNQIKGAGFGSLTGQGGCYILENDTLVFEANNLQPNGDFEFEFGGRAVALEGEPDRLLISLMGYTWNFRIDNVPEECNWDIFLQMAADLFKLIALQPQNFIQDGQFQLSARDGDEMEYPIMGLNGAFKIQLTKERGINP